MRVMLALRRPTYPANENPHLAASFARSFFSGALVATTLGAL
jgi:hypothetical protein